MDGRDCAGRTGASRGVRVTGFGRVRFGDNSTWKVQHLDLSRVEEGIVTRDDGFGYICLARSVHLQHAIPVWGWPKEQRVEIAVGTEWDLETGKLDRVEFAPSQVE